MNADRFLPELFGFFPAGGALVNVSEDRKSVGIVLDVDQTLDLEATSLTGEHVLELSMAQAADLARALLTSIHIALVDAEGGAAS